MNFIYPSYMVTFVLSTIKRILRAVAGSARNILRYPLLSLILTMIFILFAMLVGFKATQAQGANMSTIYEYYAPGGNIQSGLITENGKFVLNGKELQIFSGTMHYFRIHPQYWQDTLRKIRAAGLNTVETYMPWNLHNPRDGVFDYGELGDPMSPFLNLTYFLELARQEDLLVIIRPGPFICAEWDFGGIPSWLLRDPEVRVRSYNSPYLKAVTKFYESFSSTLVKQSFINGGSIVSIQIENEFGAFGYDDDPRDKLYLEFLKNLMDKNSLSHLLYFTSDSPRGTLDWGALPGVLMTANFKANVDEQFDKLLEMQPNEPLMVTEFWTGWFDHWFEHHHTTTPENFKEILRQILERKSSVNFYVFIGGTNFGFMAGANRDSRNFPEYMPTITSYDYDAPLSEAGDYTAKYEVVVEAVKEFSILNGKVSNPERPIERQKRNYGKFHSQGVLPINDILLQVPKVPLKDGPVNMESLPINDNNGQSYGYIAYKTTYDLAKGSNTITVRGHVRDMAQLIVDGKVITERLLEDNDLRKFGAWEARDASLPFTSAEGGMTDIIILVENLGRVNYGKPHYFNQKKGLWEGNILINNVPVSQWTAYPLEFKKDFIQNIKTWRGASSRTSGPLLYKFQVTITDPYDTFLDMSAWGKGVVFLNGFNLGRYWTVGPTMSLYIPAPLINKGSNEIVVFEQYDVSEPFLQFSDVPLLGSKVPKANYIDLTTIL